MQNRTAIAVAAVIILVMASAHTAFATQRTFVLTGTISSSTVPGVSPGASYVATLSYDDAQAPTNSGSGFAVYGSFTYSLTVSSLTFTKQSNQFLQVNDGPQDQFAAGGTTFPRLSFSLKNSAGTVFSSTALPASLSLSDFTSDKNVFWETPSTEFFLGQITSIDTPCTPTGPPVFDNCTDGSSTYLGCNPGTFPGADPSVTASDNCDAVTVLNSITNEATARFITYTASNAVGTTTCTQICTWSTAAPTIDTPPTAQTACVGSSASFSVVSNVQFPQYDYGLTYQWRRGGTPLTNGGNISGATSATLTIDPVAAGNAGSYDVVVSNACGSTPSGAVALTVNVPTATVSGGGTISPGGSATITATLTGVAPFSITWSDGITETGITTNPHDRTVSPSSTTTYTITAVSDANCTGTSSGSAAVTVNAGVCPHSHGYWKSNPAEWPASALPMMLGTSRTYTKSQLLKILKTSAGSGTNADASLILAYQLIAAKLNIAAGAEAPAPVPATIVAADAAIGGSAIPMKIRTNTSAGKTMTSLASTLEAYNKGSLNAGCGSPLKSAEGSDGMLMHDIPGSFALEQNYPNPFNPETQIRFALPEAGQVSVKIFSITGDEVRTLVRGQYQAGMHSVNWDGRDNNGQTVASGVYLYQLRAGGFTQVRKMSLLR